VHLISLVLKKMKPFQHILIAISVVMLYGSSCKKDVVLPKKYKAKNVVVIIIDGPRYSETFGDTSHQYIPELFALSKKGKLFTNIYNDGITNTINGITAITTGNYASLPNNGSAVPVYPNYLGQFIIQQHLPNNQAWIISSKDKIDAVKSCGSCNHSAAQIPQSNCGVLGNNTGYRDDSTTTAVALYTMQTYHPKALLIHFKEPDVSGHAANWNSYLNGLRSTSKYTNTIWNFLQNDSVYANATAVFITNDHGRHLDNIADGFVSHGDNCDGCTHISLVALGPDFSPAVLSNRHSQIDITNTISNMFNLQMTEAKGKAILSLLK
jgi:hypothetical protein